MKCGSNLNSCPCTGRCNCFFEVSHYEIVFRFRRPMLNQPTLFLLFPGILKHSQYFRCIQISLTSVFPWHSLLLGNKYRPLTPTGHESTALYLFCLAHRVIKSITELRVLIQFSSLIFQHRNAGNLRVFLNISYTILPLFQLYVNIKVFSPCSCG